MLTWEAMVDFGALAREGIRPLRRVEYEKMVELGLFEDERTELLAGVLVPMSPSPQGSPHQGRAVRRGGNPEYWLVNLVDKVFEVHRDPRRAGYASIARVGRGEAIAPLRFPDLLVAIDDVIPS